MAIWGIEWQFSSPAQGVLLGVIPSAKGPQVCAFREVFCTNDAAAFLLVEGRAKHRNYKVGKI